jgi:ATP-binding cassette, subfamily B, heavy metal transporter
MPPDFPTSAPDASHAGWATLRRFLPYLWPEDNRALRWRIVVAVGLIIAAKATLLALPFAYKRAIDAMTIGGSALFQVSCWPMRWAASPAPCSTTCATSCSSGSAGRHPGLAENVFAQLHRLSLRFHLARRTGEVTKVIERGTKSIDTMLYFLLFNIAPTVLELVAVAVIFQLNFGWGWSRRPRCGGRLYLGDADDHRMAHQAARKMNRLDGQALSRAVDSLLNYETVKYFAAEEREQERYAQATRAYAEAAVKSENSLGLLNIAQA